MLISLVRHAQSKRGYDESLSTQGFQDAYSVASKLRYQGGKYSRILSSPLKRSHETALAIQSNMDGLLPLNTTKNLLPHYKIEYFYQELIGLSQKNNSGGLVIVGHEPTLNELYLVLTGMHVGLNEIFNPGTIITVSADSLSEVLTDSNAHVVSKISPEQSQLTF